MKEKDIENAICNYLLSIGAWCEKLQSGKIMIKKGQYTNRMILCSNGTPDIICLYNGTMYAIEVKKNDTEQNKRLKLEARFNNGEQLPKSYKREEGQIKHKIKIIDNGGVHILTNSVQDIIEYFNKIKQGT